MFKKVKDWLGIEGVKVQLTIPQEFVVKSGEIEGGIVVTSQSEQYVESAIVILKERYKRGRRKSKLIDEYTIGSIDMVIQKPITTEEILDIPFVLPFAPLTSPMDRWGKKNFIFKGISGLAKLAKNAHSSYEIVVELSVRGNKLKPYHKMEIVAK